MGMALGSDGAFLDLRRCVLAAVVTTSCLVSFNDYPVGELPPVNGASAGVGSVVASGSGAVGSGAAASAGGSGAVGSGAVGSGATPSAGGSGGSTASGATGGTQQVGTGGDDTAGGAPGEEGGAPGHEPVETFPEDLIDDFEDTDDEILANDGRSGSWIVTNDGTGAQDPGENESQLPVLLVPARGTSQRGLHTAGKDFTDWGASVLANLNEIGNEAALYDASRYTGVRFWARSGDGLEHEARLALPSRETTTFCLTCGDHFGSDFPYSGQWREVHLPFEDMQQDGWGQVRPALKPAELLAVQLLFVDGLAFDLVVDDIGFY
jgi:hypothetical protein